MLETTATDRVVGCHPQSRQSTRGLLGKLESLIMHRDRRNTGPQRCRLSDRPLAEEPMEAHNLSSSGATSAQLGTA